MILYIFIYCVKNHQVNESLTNHQESLETSLQFAGEAPPLPRGRFHGEFLVGFHGGLLGFHWILWDFFMEFHGGLGENMVVQRDLQ